MTTLTGEQVQDLDPYAFLAVLGKRIIHPGGRAATDRVLELDALSAGEKVLDIGCGVGTTAIRLAQEYGAQVVAGDIAPLMRDRAEANVSASRLAHHVSVEDADIRTESGPFEMMTARGFLADERGHARAVMARAVSRPAYLRKTAWLLPRMSRAIPCLGYVLVSSRKPGAPGTENT